MRALDDLLAQLASLDIRVRVEGGKLRVNAPEGSLTPELAAELAAQKPALLARLAPSAPAPDGAPPPATFAQERLWFLDRLEGHPPHYNQAQSALIEGPLDPQALAAAFGRIVERHAILRTAFLDRGGKVVQEIRPIWRPDLVIEDFSAAPDPLAAARDWARSFSAQSFDLSQGQMLRVGLARLAPDAHILAVAIHHIACDGWSTGILFQELGAILAGSALAPLPVDFATAARRQRDSFDEAAFNRSFAWWRAELAGAPEFLELPTDHPISARRSFAGGRVALALSVEETRGLESLGKEAGASLFMVLLALYGLLLARHAGIDEVVVGVPVSDRTEPGFEALIGHFLNTLPLRVRLGHGPTVRELLAETRERVLEAFDHRDMPFGRLVQGLAPVRDLSRAPLVQAFFTLHNQPRQPLALPGVQVTPLPEDPVWCDFLALNLALEESGGEKRLAGALDYNAALFDEATAEAFAARFHHLIAAALADPASPVECLPLTEPTLSESEPLLGESAPEALLSAAVKAQAKRTPAAIALQAGAERLSYAELDEAVDRLAHHLHAAGIGAGALVGIALPREAGLLVALLGVLRAGAAYVPLDRGFPAERLALMAEDAGLAAVLAESSVEDIAPGVPRLSVAALLSKPLAPDAPPLPEPKGEDRAYILYTSGSTGRPKGVAISQAALAHLLWAMTREPGIAAADRLLAVTTISFDIAGLELFAPLLVGAQVVLSDGVTSSDGAALARLIIASGASLMQATPASWRLLLAAGWQPPRGFKILCGGEALPRDLAAALVAGGAALWNLYGPTETTIWSCLHRVEAGDLAEDAAAVIPIGRPIARTRLAVLDGAGRPVPPGIAGELAIGGPGVALGYHGRPDLTAERFREGWYLTGDRVRRRADGLLVFLGRADQQIKLRGFRIEPAEIEETLRSQPGIEAAVVVVREVRPGDSRLVAYLVGEVPALGSLSQALAGRLPDYMIPSEFVVLAALPLTPNGKIDRRALPAPRVVEEARLDPPVSHAEQAVAAIWGEVLGHHSIGMRDNFFTIGGHSLLTIEVQRRLEQHFRRSLDVALLFQYPTIASLAQYLTGTVEVKAETGIAQRRDRTAAVARRRHLLSEQGHE